MNVIIEESLPQTNPMILEVMKNLEESNSVTIQKDDLRKALLSYDDKNSAQIDIDLIVDQVFKDNTSLSRPYIT